VKAWILLAVSSLLQVGWIVSLERTEGFRRLTPLAWYAAFGISSTYTLSRALETIPMSTAYAVWTALSVVGSLLLDLLATRQSVGVERVVCILAIVGGTVGLRLLGTAPGAVTTAR
jgi:quaternary ammonium compound-resistance protein SugE